MLKGPSMRGDRLRPSRCGVRPGRAAPGVRTWLGAAQGRWEAQLECPSQQSGITSKLDNSSQSFGRNGRSADGAEAALAHVAQGGPGTGSILASIGSRGGLAFGSGCGWVDADSTDSVETLARNRRVSEKGGDSLPPIFLPAAARRLRDLRCRRARAEGFSPVAARRLKDFPLSRRGGF
jgi:hypothetical protein